MMISEIKEIYLRDLKKLSEEIGLFTDESAIWKTAGDIKNSSGNLCLHLCGNLQHFIGAQIGKTGYVRDRDAEFSSRNIPASKLQEEISKAEAAVTIALDKMKEEELATIYPQTFIGKDVTNGYFLVFLIAHFNYHLGQVNYLRRVL